jgi:hypothetical protein
MLMYFAIIGLWIVVHQSRLSVDVYRIVQATVSDSLNSRLAGGAEAAMWVTGASPKGRASRKFRRKPEPDTDS